MSISKINAFCNFINHNIIKDNNTRFILNDDHIKSDIKSDIKYLISTKNPQISINDMIKHILKNIICNAEDIDNVILYTVNLINNIKIKGIYLNYLTTHRILLISILLACKICNDEHYDNKTWANMTGLKIIDINKMEITILKLFDFNLLVIMTPEKSLAIYKTIY